MVSFIPFIPLRRFLFVFASTVLAGFSLTSFLLHQQTNRSATDVTWIVPNVTSYRQFCRQLDRRIEQEVPSGETLRLQPGYQSISYAYSEWQSTSLMPRVLTACEHAIYMRLLSILVQQVFEKYNIPYMMMAATLLGSFVFCEHAILASMVGLFQVAIHVMISCRGTMMLIYALEFLIGKNFSPSFATNWLLPRIRLF